MDVLTQSTYWRVSYYYDTDNKDYYINLYKEDEYGIICRDTLFSGIKTERKAQQLVGLLERLHEIGTPYMHNYNITL